MSNLFEDGTPPEIDPNKDYRAELVGEGKKYKDDAALALSKVHADRLIDDLKRQLQESQSELQTRNRLEELLTEATRKRDEPRTDPVNNNQNRDEAVNDLTSEKIESLISERLTQHERNRSASDNVRSVKDALTKQFGDDMSGALTRAAREAGVTPEWLEQQAQVNPKLVINLVQANQPKREAYLTPPSSTLNPELVQSNDERTWAFYQKIKAKDAKYYDSKEVQSQMHRDALRLKDRFFVTQ